MPANIQTLNLSSGGASKFILGQQLEDVVADNAVEYGGFMSRNSLSGSAVGREFTAPCAFTLKNFVVNIRANSGNTTDQILAVQVNGLDTLLEITVPFNTDGIFTVTEDITIDKDDVLRVKVSNLVNTGTFTINSYASECEI